MSSSKLDLKTKRIEIQLTQSDSLMEVEGPNTKEKQDRFTKLNGQGVAFRVYYSRMIKRLGQLMRGTVSTIALKKSKNPPNLKSAIKDDQPPFTDSIATPLERTKTRLPNSKSVGFSHTNKSKSFKASKKLEVGKRA